MEILQLIVLLLFIIGGIGTYFAYTYKESEKIDVILNKNKCPKCNSKNIVTDFKNNGCSPTQTLIFKCNNCKKEGSWTIPGKSSCSL